MEHQKPRVKICCISSVEEARTAIDFGASAIGLVSEMPSGPGVISEEMIGKIAMSIPARIDTFLLTREQNPETVYRSTAKKHASIQSN
jgi:phosphoribosylanthranilate isomerase